jgi:membrane-associated phospholipid phosphatase
VPRAPAPGLDGGTTPAARFGARALLAAVALVLLAVPFGLLLLFVEDRWRPLLGADAAARDDLHAYAAQHPAFVTAMQALSTLGSAPAYVVVFLAVVCWLLWRRRRRLAAYVVVSLVGSALLNEVVKRLVDRARPVLPHPVARAAGWSFPSGHAQSAVVAYTVLLIVFVPLVGAVLRRLLVAFAVVMVLAIGFSRVALGVHFVSDVLAGYALGAAWVVAMTAAFAAWRREARTVR